jgi:signal transduction histidine kinase
MQVSKRFLSLLEQQLAQFADRPDLREIVVYAALPADNGKPSLVVIGQWPAQAALPQRGGDGVQMDDVEADAADQHTGSGIPLGEARRWLALRDGTLLLGALRVDASTWPWPEPLSTRLEATARCLTEALRLDLEQQRLSLTLAHRDEQLRLLVHQLRNPLAALRTFAQLLRRRLDGDPGTRNLVDQLLAEQGQMTRYVDALDQLAPTPGLGAGEAGPTPLLLPPGLSEGEPQQLSDILAPLLERAGATASLQGRAWQPPRQIPGWRGDGSAVAEIVANLLENAFRYSAAGGAIGLHGSETPDAINLAVWDCGPEIPAAERPRIFERGVRGSTGQHLPGTGLGLALARDLARSLGGDLELVVPPQQLSPADPQLPGCGNAFRLKLPVSGCP